MSVPFVLSISLNHKMWMVSALSLALLVSVSCHPSRRGSVHVHPHAVEVTFDISVLDGSAVSEAGDTITVRAGQMIRMTCRIQYDKQLGMY